MATVKRKTDLASAAPRGAKTYSTTNTTTSTNAAPRRARRDWVQITFLVLSVVIVLSMVLGSIAYLFQ